MSTFGLLFLPAHVNEGALHVVVDDVGPTARSLLDLLLVRRVALDAQPDLLQSSLLHHLLGDIAVLYVLKEPVHRCAVDGCNRNSLRYSTVILWLFLLIDS